MLWRYSHGSDDVDRLVSIISYLQHNGLSVDEYLLGDAYCLVVSLDVETWFPHLTV